MIKVAFLALDDVHHIPHIAPVAFELSKHPDYACTLFIQPHSQGILDNIAALYPDHHCQIKRLSPHFFTKIKYFLRKKVCGSWRVIRDRVSELLPYDLFISPDVDMQFLMDAVKKRGKAARFFLMTHGAGDRDRVREGYAVSAHQMDLILLNGEKFRALFSDHYRIPSERCVVIGYPKFDIVSIHSKQKLFNNDKPVILYNPHFCRDQSSWYPWGLAILDYFYQQSAFNLIFAPHCNLFKRTLSPRCIPKAYWNCDHMRMDLGSIHSADMTYTQAADIYMGDVSSQVYEFIRIPRPCLFLNPHRIDWQNRQPYYESWRFGTVIEQLEDLWSHLMDDPMSNPYRDRQIQSFQNTFSIEARSAAERAVAAIHVSLA